MAERLDNGAGAQDGRCVRLLDLPAPERESQLAEFDRALYRPAFPNADVREDISVWLHLMEERPPAPAPLISPILERDASGALRGGAVLELYRGSRIGLLTYLVTGPDYRGRGVARRLLAAVQAEAASFAGAASGMPILAEAERPDPEGSEQDRAAQEGRLKILAGLGAVFCDLDYIQPPLAPGRAHRSLILMALRSSLPENAALGSSRLAGFLAELYQSLGCDPKTDPGFQRMEQTLQRRKRVHFAPLEDRLWERAEGEGLRANEDRGRHENAQRASRPGPDDG